MQVLSPYRKDVLAELKNIYGFDSVETATDFMIRHIQQHYQFQEVSVEMLHIAYGLVAKLKADSEIYYLKFASRSNSFAINCWCGAKTHLNWVDGVIHSVYF
ncbi:MULTISPECIES: hypothetical protein [Fischerella]|uniref:hypothetical protein n=1 Tax=Fischerella TaxID=1190 RepID=UPI0002DAE25A|nr:MULTISPECIES: hypothetical protein [Fischerella]MBD2430454.1 hypothetical protein [Fischerella sp. FACHB-380]